MATHLMRCRYESKTVALPRLIKRPSGALNETYIQLVDGEPNQQFVIGFRGQPTTVPRDAAQPRSFRAWCTMLLQLGSMMHGWFIRWSYMNISAIDAKTGFLQSPHGPSERSFDCGTRRPRLCPVGLYGPLSMSFRGSKRRKNSIFPSKATHGSCSTLTPNIPKIQKEA